MKMRRMMMPDRLVLGCSQNYYLRLFVASLCRKLCRNLEEKQRVSTKAADKDPKMAVLGQALRYARATIAAARGAVGFTNGCP